MNTRSLGDTGLVVSRLGFGLAAVGRPAYITLGRDRDLPSERTPDALEGRAHELLDAAFARGVRYFDAARSYGRAEAFLAAWLQRRQVPRHAVTIGSKWGYAYTADWKVEAPVHEQKELTLARFRTQLEESRALLGPWLDLYQIHSATVESGCLDDGALLAALCEGRCQGWYRAIGLTLSGPASATTLSRALEARSDGVRVFDVVHATFNLLEPSLRAGLADTRAAGLGVIIKEAHANGRLTPANDLPRDFDRFRTLARLAQEIGLGVDQLALLWVLQHDFVDVVLSGAATAGQLDSHLAAVDLGLPKGVGEQVASLAQSPEEYWAFRQQLPWQ